MPLPHSWQDAELEAPVTVPNLPVGHLPGAAQPPVQKEPLRHVGHAVLVHVIPFVMQMPPLAEVTPQLFRHVPNIVPTAFPQYCPARQAAHAVLPNPNSTVSICNGAMLVTP